MSRKKTKSAERESREKIRELTDENMRLHREIDFLKNELQREKRSTRQLLHKRDKVESAFLRQAKNEGAFSQKKYFSYIRHSVKNASVFWIYAGIINAVRRFTFVSTTIRILIFLLSLIQSGAVFIISTSAFIIALPFVFLFSGIGFMLTFLGSRRAIQKARPMVKGKKVTVFFPANRRAFDNDSYFSGMVREVAAKPDSLCVIVSPGLFFSRGIFEKRRYYFTTRTDGDNVVIVRRHFYYRFKNRVLLKDAAKITEIY